MEIKPFKAFRYDAKVVGDTGSCLAPPYDVISDQQQQKLYEKNEYNIIRIIKGKIEPSDNGSSNQYTRAAEYLNAWIENGALKQDSAETIYTYVQDFTIADARFQRFSFIALAKLEEFGKIVRPHEQTLDKPIIDRLNLKRVTNAKFGLVFMLYEDQEKIADKLIEKSAKGQPLIDFIDEQNVRHRLFSVINKEDTDAIAKMMSNKSCIIADGHHRYITGLTFAKENPEPEAKYQMIAFSNTCHEGLIVLATHRLVGNLEKFDAGGLITGLAENFELQSYPFDSDAGKTKAGQMMLKQINTELNNGKNSFGVYCGTNVFYTAVLRDKKTMDLAAVDKSHAWRSLDVAVLHKLILEGLLGLDEKKLAAGGNVDYVKDTENVIEELITKVDKGLKQVVFFMNPPKIQQIQNVADMGEKMPQKSTYFYPKIFTGLTINKL